MSDTDKTIQTLLQKFAALETEVSGYRKANKEPAFDHRALINDPVGVLNKLGVPVEHITKILVANQLGDAAPHELRSLAQMGPMVNATSDLRTQLESLSRQVSDLVTAQKGSSTRASFKALANDKTKYPNLSKALNKRTDRYDDEAAKFEGTAEEYATQKEAYLKEMAELFGAPAASEENADETVNVEMTSDEQEAAQSKESRPANAAGLNGEVPPLTRKDSGVFGDKERQALKDSVLRKYNLQ